jgi:hypothetical protein
MIAILAVRSTHSFAMHDSYPEIRIAGKVKAHHCVGSPATASARCLRLP